ncbi:hypothetical protein PoB_000587000 [Plakobranchus ocellatus]|uniref:Uncharacterized protein n=1 Tax=Plakobranchus ocellatus TaxID=259542 RepID=A0AAV3Y990_9GAST|nr:hypothetical protein PoB_000587000 [Plakobranchus ocellatus]
MAHRKLSSVPTDTQDGAVRRKRGAPTGRASWRIALAPPGRSVSRLCYVPSGVFIILGQNQRPAQDRRSARIGPSTDG